MTYVWPDRLPPRPVELHRYWRDGKIISSNLLPPGSYLVLLKKIQVDFKERHQYHWELILNEKQTRNHLLSRL